MKAVKIQKFGSPKYSSITDVKAPVPAAGEVLVKILAASVNASDIEWMKGLFLVRFMGSSGRRVLGSDMAGIVHSVGSGVSLFQPGDEVMADLYSIGMGAFAEYVCVAESELRKKPTQLSFPEAAALPQAGVCALQGIRSGHVQPGGAVLINGAGGGMGSFAVQIAKSMGASITAVDRADKFDLLYSLGVDRCLDYRQQHYTDLDETFDFILDMNTTLKMPAYRRMLKPGGVFTVVGGKPRAILAAYMAGSGKASGNRQIGLLMWKPNSASDMEELQQMIQKDQLKPVIDKTFTLNNAIEAIEYCWQGNARGKVVLTMGEENEQ